MTSVTSKIPEEFKVLSANDRVEYLQDLWDYIADSPDQVPVPDAHKQVLDDRLAAYKAEPNLGKPWEQIRDNILNKLQNT